MKNRTIASRLVGIRTATIGGRTTQAIHYCFDLPMQYRCVCDRAKICPLQGVSEARKISPFAPSESSLATLNVGPGSRTDVLPASLRKYTRPPAAIGDAVYLPSAMRSRQSCLPVVLS